VISNAPLHVKKVESVLRDGKDALRTAFHDAIIGEQWTRWEVLP
jgi:hypothetical protein